MNLLNGLRGLIESRKGVAFLLVLIISTVLTATGKLQGQWLAAIVATIFPTWAAAHSYQECNAPTIPPKGTL